VFPRFHVIRVGSGEAFGSVTSTSFGNERWVADGWIGYLLAGMKPIPGRWHARGEFWNFAPDEYKAVSRLKPKTEWIIRDGYCGARADLVLDTDINWQKQRYNESDHDHCAICSQTLGLGGQPDGYMSKNDIWVCCRCYEEFICKRSLEFIPLT
jgi:hypothetical protein